MRRQSKRVPKWHREEARINHSWVNENVIHRLTPKDKEILKFIHKHGIVKREHIEKIFFNDSRNSKFLCQRRLRVLFDLHLVDRYFPQKEYYTGTSQQHLVLDRAAAIVLNICDFKKINKLPKTYMHTIAVVQLYVELHDKGIRNWITEVDLGKIKPDVYCEIQDQKMFIEMDIGTETFRTIKSKINGYKDVNQIKDGTIKLVFITYGTDQRVRYVIELSKELGIPIKVQKYNKK